VEHWGPVNGTIAGKRRTWYPGSCHNPVLYCSIVLLDNEVEYNHWLSSVCFFRPALAESTWSHGFLVASSSKNRRGFQYWLRNGWTKQNLPVQEDAISIYRFDELLYIGTGSVSRVLSVLSFSAGDTLSIA
jgi:hypothetical protein